MPLPTPAVGVAPIHPRVSLSDCNSLPQPTARLRIETVRQARSLRCHAARRRAAGTKDDAIALDDDDDDDDDDAARPIKRQAVEEEAAGGAASSSMAS